MMNLSVSKHVRHSVFRFNYEFVNDKFCAFCWQIILDQEECYKSRMVALGLNLPSSGSGRVAASCEYDDENSAFVKCGTIFN